MPRKSQITVTSRADAARTRNAALARRLQGNPFGGGNRAIPLKEPGRFHTYIENTYLNENAFYEMKEKGWEPLTPEDLACEVKDSGFRLSEDGYLVRGEHGREMIFKMSKEDYRELEAAKTRANNRGIGSASKIRDEVANAAAGSLGSEAADYISKLPGQVIDHISGGEAQ